MNRLALSCTIILYASAACAPTPGTGTPAEARAVIREIPAVTATPTAPMNTVQTAPEMAEPQTGARTAPRSKPRRVVAPAPSETAPPRQEPGSGGAGSPAALGPRAAYYWDDCLMAGFAVLPHCAI